MTEDSKKIIKHEWFQVISIVVTVAGLFLWNHSEMHSNQRDNRAIIDAINKEIKDFHGRLERQDAEFKGTLAKQDAEFKTGLLLIEERMRK